MGCRPRPPQVYDSLVCGQDLNQQLLELGKDPSSTVATAPSSSTELV